MNKIKNKNPRKPIRLKNWDYSSPGYYFVTICTKDHQHFFGVVVDNKMQLSQIGKIAENCWQEIPHHFQHVKLDEFIFMPNHVHGILILTDTHKGVGTPHVVSLP